MMLLACVSLLQRTLSSSETPPQPAPCIPMGDVHLLMATLTKRVFVVYNGFLHLFFNRLLHLFFNRLLHLFFNCLLHQSLIVASKSLWRSHSRLPAQFLSHNRGSHSRLPAQLLSRDRHPAQLLEQFTNHLVRAPSILFPQLLPSMGLNQALNMTVLMMKMIVRMKFARVVVTL